MKNKRELAAFLLAKIRDVCELQGFNENDFLDFLVEFEEMKDKEKDV